MGSEEPDAPIGTTPSTTRGCSHFSLWNINASGLGNKAPLFTFQAPAICAVQETHLTAYGQDKFAGALRAATRRAQHGGWQTIWSHPCRLRRGGEVGGIAEGTNLMTTGQLRSMNQFLPAETMATSRVAVATMRQGTQWLVGASVYGYSLGGNHDKPLEQTNELLVPIVELLLRHGSRAAFLAGDLNHDLEHLSSLTPLLEAGWQDVQDWAASHFGFALQPTCKGATRRDYILASPTLLQRMTALEAFDHMVPTHTVLRATFTVDEVLKSPQWPIPKQLPKISDELWIPFPEDTDITAAYKKWWHNIEQAWPLTPEPGACGRATMEQPVWRVKSTAPVPKTRAGMEPVQGWHHSRSTILAYTQLARLQSLRHLLPRVQDATALEKATNTWLAILRAKGFRPDFPTWIWQSTQQPWSSTGLPTTTWLTMAETKVKQEYHRRIRHDRALQDERRPQGWHDSLTGIYKELRRPPPAVVEALAEIRQATVVYVDTDQHALQVDTALQWNVDCPVTVAGTQVSIGHVEDDTLWVDTTNADWLGQQITQIERDQTEQETVQRITDYWQSFWCKHTDHPWDEEDYRRLHVHQDPVMDLPPIDALMVRRHVQALKQYSATGPDGVARADLLQLPNDMLTELCKLFAHAEQTGEWPRTMTHSIIRSLAKVDDPLQASQTRPIQVLSLVYRTWGSLRAKQIIPQLSSRVHSGIYAIAQRGPDAVAWQLQQAIEQALQDRAPLQGVILDLVKAYDHLPRLPVWQHAISKGIPKGVLRAWGGMVTHLERHVQVGQTVGDGIATIVGFPQGDAMSCVAMLLINDLTAQWLAQDRVDDGITMYADNWQLTATDPQYNRQQTASLMALTTRLDLPIDAAKTEVWATTTEGRQELRGAYNKVVSVTKDLGYSMSYSRRHYTMVQKKRQLTMRRDFWLLRQSQAPLNYKLVAVQVVLWKRFLHGIELAPLSHADMHKLRSQACRGLGFMDKGTNAWAVLNLLLPRNVDPEYYQIRHTLQSARKWFWREPHTIQIFQDWLQPHRVATADGPMMAILKCFQYLGWHLHEDGSVTTHSKHQLNWISCGCKQLDLHLGEGWLHVVAGQLHSRRGFEKLGQPDTRLTQAKYKTWGPTTTSLLRKMGGACFYTNDHFATTTGNDQCPACQAHDGHEHRLFYCKESYHIRAKRWPQQEWRDIPPHMRLHGVADHPQEWHDYMNFLDNIRPTVDSKIAVTSTDEILHCFTDGSSNYPTDPDLRRGACAAACWNPDSLSFEILGTERMAGRLQGSDRAEIYAAWWTCRCAQANGKTIELWTDYEGLVTMVAHFPQRIPDHLLAHGDLLWDIYTWWQQGVLRTVNKVHSHQINNDTPGHIWAQQGNTLVDIQAGATSWTWWTDEEELWYPLYIKKQELRETLTMCQEHLVEVAGFYRRLLKRQTETEHPETMPSTLQEVTRTTGTWNYQTRKRQRIHEVPESLQLSAAAADDWAQRVGFGPASRFWAFMVSIWSPQTSQRWVSWAQLAILFLAVTGDYPIHDGHTKRRRSMVAPPARGEAKLWSDMISTMRGLAMAAGQALPWLMTSLCQRPSDSLRIVTTCTAWRIDPFMLDQCDTVITRIIHTTAVSSTAFQTPVTRAHLQGLNWPTLQQDQWPGNTWQSRLRRTVR